MDAMETLIPVPRVSPAALWVWIEGGAIQMALKEGWKGRYYEDFEVGDVYRCPFGRTVIEADNVWFTLLTGI